MTTEYPDAPQRPGRPSGVQGMPEHVQEMLSCLTEEEVATVLTNSIALEAAALIDVPSAFSVAYATAEEGGTHLLGHSLQAGLTASRDLVLKMHGPADVLVFAPPPCDDPEHQITHTFVQDFANDVLNARNEDAMAGWRQFLTDCADDYNAYLNGVYGVCRASIAVVIIPPERGEIPELGSVLQFSANGGGE